MIPIMAQIDLCQDLENLARNGLVQLGFDAEKVKGLQNPLVKFFEYHILHIPMKKRKVCKSDVFQCPKQYEQALEEFIQKVENGEDINPFLSNKKDDLEANDLLLYDWKIYHFHLTRRYNSNGQPTRSNYLIFAVYTDETMFFIQIYKHQKKAVFAQKELLEIMSRNWPQLAAYREVKNVSVRDITDEERLAIRNKHELMLTNIYGKTYFSLGGGYVSNGSSLRAVQLSDLLLDAMKDLEKWIFLNLSSIHQKYERIFEQSLWKKQLSFKLVACEKDGYIILERYNHFVMNIQPNNGGFKLKEIKVLF